MITYCSLLTPTMDTLSEPLSWRAQLTTIMRNAALSEAPQLSWAEKKAQASRNACLGELYPGKWHRVSEVFRQLKGPGFCSSNVSHRLGELHKMGLVDRKGGDSGYAVYYKLTEKGEEERMKLLPMERNEDEQSN